MQPLECTLERAEWISGFDGWGGRPVGQFAETRLERTFRPSAGPAFVESAGPSLYVKSLSFFTLALIVKRPLLL